MDEIRRGAEARMILDHELVREAFASFREQLAAQRQRVGIKDTEMHTRLIMAEQSINSFESWFRQVIDTGKMADIALRKPRLPIFQR